MLELDFFLINIDFNWPWKKEESLEHHATQK